PRPRPAMPGRLGPMQAPGTAARAHPRTRHGGPGGSAPIHAPGTVVAPNREGRPTPGMGNPVVHTPRRRSPDAQLWAPGQPPGVARGSAVPADRVTGRRRHGGLGPSEVCAFGSILM